MALLSVGSQQKVRASGIEGLRDNLTEGLLGTTLIGDWVDGQIKVTDLMTGLFPEVKERQREAMQVWAVLRAGGHCYAAGCFSL